MGETTNYFKTLNGINVEEHIEKKGGLRYLSWAWAWGEVKKVFPNATYKIYENTLPSGYVVNYFTDGKTAYVKTGVIINDLEHIEELPVMDYNNKSIPLEKMTSFDVNKAIQRSLTKACARHGLGLYVYAGEDLPEDEQNDQNENATKSSANSKVDTKANYGKTHKELVDSVTKQFDSLDDTKKDKWVAWLEKQGQGGITDFDLLPDSILACMDKNLSR